MSISGSHEGLQQKRRSLEEKAKTLEEKARLEKLAIDKKLAVEILEEENRTHEEAVKELEDRIANLEQQMKTSPSAENAPTETDSEPAEETSGHVSEDVSAGMLPPPEQTEVEVSQEGSRKKKRNLF
jgi:predicted  nucleic acid-binding Zn-ribbon protein